MRNRPEVLDTDRGGGRRSGCDRGRARGSRRYRVSPPHGGRYRTPTDLHQLGWHANPMPVTRQCADQRRTSPGELLPAGRQLTRLRVT